MCDVCVTRISSSNQHFVCCIYITCLSYNATVCEMLLLLCGAYVGATPVVAWHNTRVGWMGTPPGELEAAGNQYIGRWHVFLYISNSALNNSGGWFHRGHTVGELEASNNKCIGRSHWFDAVAPFSVGWVRTTVTALTHMCICFYLSKPQLLCNSNCVYRTNNPCCVTHSTLRLVVCVLCVMIMFMLRCVYAVRLSACLRLLC